MFFSYNNIKETESLDGRPYESNRRTKKRKKYEPD